MSLLWSTLLLGQEVPSGEIWYSEPAEEWNDALPVGNGRMGAMVFGDPQRERIQLNEDSLWPGGPEWGNAKGTPEQLDQLRELILAGEVHLADSLIVEYFSYKEIGRSHQTHEGFLRILPALPEAWMTGNVRGLKARGNITVDISWEEGRLSRLQLQSARDTELRIVYDGALVEILLRKDQTTILGPDLKQL